jgi:di/tripeptidase
MTRDKLDRLKEVLSVPTHSKNEELMIEYITEVLDEKGYEHYVDKMGNIYATKGEAEFYPCFVSHTDTVHKINHDMRVVQLEEGENTILTGIDIETMRPSGIGGDDKCGVFLCLEMLDALDNVKAAFFVSEEIGCIGSRQADPEFFKNVGYAIQYDSPKGNSMSMTLMGKQLFGRKTDFGKKVSPLILEHGIDDWAYHPFTDIWPLMDKFGFSCLNLAAGYYNYHTDNEYVIVEDVDNAYELGLKLHEELGEAYYERPEDKVQTRRSYGYGGQGGYGGGRHGSYGGGYGEYSYLDEDPEEVNLLTEGVDDNDVDHEDLEDNNGTLEIDGVLVDMEEDYYDEWEDFNNEDFGTQRLPYNETGGATIEYHGGIDDLTGISDPYHFEW